MSTSNINIRIDSDLKKEAEVLFKDIGLTMTSAITVFLKYAVNHDGIPFAMKRNLPNRTTKAAIAEHSEMLKDPESYKRYDSIDDIMSEIFIDDKR